MDVPGTPLRGGVLVVSDQTSKPPQFVPFDVKGQQLCSEFPRDVWALRLLTLSLIIWLQHEPVTAPVCRRTCSWTWRQMLHSLYGSRQACSIFKWSCSRSRWRLRQMTGRRRMKTRRMYVTVVAFCAAPPVSSLVFQSPLWQGCQVALQVYGWVYALKSSLLKKGQVARPRPHSRLEHLASLNLAFSLVTFRCRCSDVLLCPFSAI